MSQSLLDKLLANADLADSTKANYKVRFRKMEEFFGTNLEQIMLHPEKYAEMLGKYYPSIKTQKGQCIAILSVFKHSPEFKTEHKKAYDDWREHMMALDDVIRDQTENNLPTQRQLDGFVPFDEFKKMMDVLPRGSIDRLLVALYGGGGIYPVRADFNRVKIYKRAVPRDHEPNYLLLQKKDDMRLVIGEYKTAKQRGPIEIDVPPVLRDEIATSLRLHPRDWLIADRNGNPYVDNAYVKLVNRRFLQIFGKPLTIGILRHAAINSLDLNTLSVHQKQQIAHQMGHSALRQMDYRLLIKGEDGANKVLGEGSKDASSN